MFVRIAAAAAALILSSSALALAQSAMAPAAAPLTVKLSAQNGSGETGVATLTNVDGGVMVSVKMIGDPAGVAQPIHIHVGPCATLDPKPKYPLTTVQDGVSVTTVKGIAIADLLASPFAINVHKSTTEVGIYVACGDITKPK